MSFTGSDLLTTRHMGNSTASASGVRLPTRSAGKFFASTAATLRAAAVPSSSVVPSGSARATVTAAKVPPPPGRLSMITGSLVAAVIIPDRMADHVGGAAGRQRRHDLDRPRRPILRPDAG